MSQEIARDTTGSYFPDAWVIVRVAITDEAIDKVLAGWSGGYLHGDSWRMNSGIHEVVDLGDSYEFIGASGSSYVCRKTAERMTMLMASTFSTLEKRAFEHGGSIERISVEDVAALSAL